MKTGENKDTVDLYTLTNYCGKSSVAHETTFSPFLISPLEGLSFRFPLIHIPSTLTREDPSFETHKWLEVIVSGPVF